MELDPKDMREIDQRLTAVLGAEYWLRRAAEIRESKVPTAEFVLMGSLPGTLGAVAAYACSGEFFHMASNGLKELRARTHEHRAHKVLDE
jgi:hypothetical protein